MAFPLGKSGNPTGRRKEKLFYEALMQTLKNADPKNPRTLRRIAEKLCDLALDGDMQAINTIANRIDGMPLASVDINATVTDISDQERRSRLVELLELGAAKRIALPAGTGEAVTDQKQPETIRPIH
jgi:hypothetical protein